MSEGIAELTASRRQRLLATIHRLEDDDLRVRVEGSYSSDEPTIEEWHDFVEGVDLAMRSTKHLFVGVTRYSVSAPKEKAA
jgi:hypothetical protein